MRRCGGSKWKTLFLVLEKAHLRIYGTPKPDENVCFLHRNGACALAPVQDTRLCAGGPFIFAKRVVVSSRMRRARRCWIQPAAPYHPPAHIHSTVWRATRVATGRGIPQQCHVCVLAKHRRARRCPPARVCMALHLFGSQLFAHLYTHTPIHGPSPPLPPRPSAQHLNPIEDAWHELVARLDATRSFAFETRAESIAYLWMRAGG